MPYASYSATDFASDSFFQAWILDADEQACAFWESWVVSHPEKQQAIQEAKDLLRLLRQDPDPPRATEKASTWNSIQAACEAFDQQESQAVKSLPQRPYFTFYPVAAAFLGLLLLSAILYLVSQPPDTTTYATGYGETATYVLPDSSVITLNANSTLAFEQDWSAVREVWVQGEAFFSVAHSENKKFIVHTRYLDIEVLGTRFNVNDRRGSTQVVLNAGQVQLKSSPEDSLMMLPGELVSFSEEKKVFEKQAVDPDAYISWMNKMLTFEETSLADIAIVLEDRYGFQVRFGDENIAEETFTGAIPADQVEVFFDMLDAYFEVERDDKTLTINYK